MSPFTLLYGPFENAKKIYVGTAMGSMHYQWLATSFLPKDKINKILKTNNNSYIEKDSKEKKDTSNFIQVSNKKDSTLELIKITDENEKFNGYALVIKDPTRVSIGISSKLFESGETVSKIAENYDAVAAINGGYFTDDTDMEQWSSNGGIPTGFLMAQGEIKQNIDPNIETPIVAITKGGELLIGKTKISELLSKKSDDKDTVTDAMSYVTTLVENGNPSIIEMQEGSSPKTMIGQRKDGSIVFVVLDSMLPGGRICATLNEAQNVMINLECYNAVNLDGGKSSTMYLNGEIINQPSYALGERPISAGFIVK